MASSLVHDEREAVHQVNDFFYQALDDLVVEVDVAHLDVAVRRLESRPLHILHDHGAGGRRDGERALDRALGAARRG